MIAKKKKRYPGHLELRGIRYYFRCSIQGERYSFPLQQNITRSQAERIAQEIYEIEINKRKIIQEFNLSPVRIDKLFDYYLDHESGNVKPNTVRTYKEAIKPLRMYLVDKLGNPLSTDVSARMIEQYSNWRRYNKLNNTEGSTSNTTILKDLRVLNAIMKFGVRMQILAVNPVEKIKKPKPNKFDPIILADDKYLRLIENCSSNPMLSIHVHLMGECGLREQESLHIEWSDINFEDNKITVKNKVDFSTKNNETRRIPISNRLMVALRKHLTFCSTSANDFGIEMPKYLMFHMRTCAQYKRGERIRSLYDSFKSACKMAQIVKSFRQHDLRHTRCTRWISCNSNLAAVQQAMGHKDIKTTMKYYKFVDEHLKGIVDDSILTDSISS